MEEVQERGVRFEALAAGDLGDEIQILQAGEGRGGSCACRRPTDVALIQPWWCRSSHVEHHTQNTSSKPCRKRSTEGSRLQPLPSKWQEQEREKIVKETGMMRRRQVGGTKALRWVLLWILLGVKKQMVEALEEEIPANQETDRMLETARVHRVGHEI